MTICIAALGANSKAIVCVADKAITYGEVIQSDTECLKIIDVGKAGMVVLTSGDDDITTRLLRKLRKSPMYENLGKNLENTILCCETVYSECANELRESSYLTPYFLKREDFVRAISGPQINPYMKNLAYKVSKPLGFEFILCGFDDSGKAFIVSLDERGIATEETNTGFATAGGGSDFALSRFLQLNSKRKDPIGRVLHDCFSAKADAEIAQGVGYWWDAKILLRGNKKQNKKPQIIKVNEDIKNLVEGVWKFYTKNPFDEKEMPRKPPKRWKPRLIEYGDNLLKKYCK